VAGDGALAARLGREGIPAANAREVVDLVRAGDREATRLVRDAGRSLGEVLASAVNFFNPRVIVIGATSPAPTSSCWPGSVRWCSAARPAPSGSSPASSATGQE
jgi:predicted NBD/HSP70 family sugar kinase